MKSLQKFLAIFLAMLMVFAVSPLAVFAANDDAAESGETDTEESTEEPQAAWYTSFGLKKGEGTLAQAAANVASGGSVSLLRNITDLGETIAFTTNTTLEGNGFTITKDADFTGSLFTVSEEAKVTFTHVTISGGNEDLSIPASPHSSMIAIENGTVVLDEGAKLSDICTGAAAGGAVSVGTAGSTVQSALVMNEGSEISNCMANSGGAVLVYDKAVFKMTGGVIRNCSSSTSSGAVAVVGNGAQFIMQGGEITECTAGLLSADSPASAVFVADGASATITDSKIYANTNKGGLGAVYAQAGSSITVGGAVYLYDNTDASGNGSNIYIEENAVLTVSPDFAEGAKIGVTVENMDPNNISLSFIDYDGELTGYLYDDASNTTFYVSNGVVTLIETINVTFDPGNGTCAVGSKIYPVDIDFGYLPTPDEREGFEFLGWYTANDVLITESSAVTFQEDITLYAKWENLNAIDTHPFAVIGRFFERIGELMRMVFQFLTNLFTGTGDKQLGDL